VNHDNDRDDEVLVDSDEAFDEVQSDHVEDDGSPGGWPGFSSVFVLRAKRPFEDWVRQLPDVPGELTPLDFVMAFATPELGTASDADSWLAEHYEEMFARFLTPWADEPDWPAHRSFETFQSWFDVVFAADVEDMTDVGADEEEYAQDPPPEVTCAPLSLREVRDRFLELPQDGSLHVDITSGELFTFTDDELDTIEGDVDDAESDAELRELRDALDAGTLEMLAHSRHLPLLDLMHDFTEQMDPGTLRNRLLNALQGRKARAASTTPSTWRAFGRAGSAGSSVPSPG
jgi:hypothetical protein